MGIKIAHFADIHIRPVSRHDEYRIVLKDAAKKMKESNVDIVLSREISFIQRPLE